MKTLLAILALVAATTTTKDALESDGPIDFRCDSMQVFTKPNRTVCLDNVVVRRSGLLVCCNRFEGFANDDWAWQRFICVGDVRARRGDENAWASQGEFDLATSDLTMTGRPHLERGKSHFEGVRVILNVNADQARIVQPKGVFVQEDKRPVPPPQPAQQAAELPAKCPLSARPIP